MSFGGTPLRGFRPTRAWINNVIDNKVFCNVYEDNLGMFDPRFERFVESLRPVKPIAPQPPNLSPNTTVERDARKNGARPSP